MYEKNYKPKIVNSLLTDKYNDYILNVVFANKHGPTERVEIKGFGREENLTITQFNLLDYKLNSIIEIDTVKNQVKINDSTFEPIYNKTQKSLELLYHTLEYLPLLKSEANKMYKLSTKKILKENSQEHLLKKSEILSGTQSLIGIIKNEIDKIEREAIERMKQQEA